jgi:DNA-binding response OmpR family regulator
MAKILVVDDESSLRKLLSIVLSKDGYEILDARDGQEAISIIEQEAPDLAVVDLMMPVVDGLDLCRCIRTDPRFEHIPILMISGASTIVDKAQGFEAGIDDFLAKPFDLLELRYRVEALLRRANRANPISVAPPRFRLETKSCRAWVDGQPIVFTKSETAILEYLLRHTDQIVSKHALLEGALNYEPGEGKTGAARVHIVNIRKKLSAVPGGESLIQTFGHGYRLVLS